MLDLWAGTRAMALSLLRYVRPEWRESCAAWCQIWQRRREWSA
jgi:hypothetical protein